MTLDRAARAQASATSGRSRASRCQRVDIPAMVTGQFEFVHNVRVPGMLHGRVVRPPVVGATLVGVDESSVRGVPGSSRSSSRTTSSASSPRSRGRRSRRPRTLKVDVDGGHAPAGRKAISTSICAIRSRRGTRCSSTRRTWTSKLAGAADVVQRNVPLPVSDARLDRQRPARWPTCRATRRRSGRRRRPSIRCSSTAAMVLGLAARERARRFSEWDPGCYGVNGADTVSYDAALLSQAVGQARARQLSRQGRDGVGELRLRVRHRPASRARRRRQHRRVGPRVLDRRRCGGRPGCEHAGKRRHRLAGRLRAARVRAAHARTGAERGFDNGSNAAPSYVTGCVGGACGGTGTIRASAC